MAGSLAYAKSPEVSPTHEFVLDNGMKFVVREDHRAPVVVSQIWYKVGSSYEPNGKTGISHVLEHMMFKGTPRVPTGEFSNIVSRYGGSENAFTSVDYTGYYQKFEASKLPLSFELEADRMRNLLLPAKEFEKELKVVMEERRQRTDDRPVSWAYERFRSMAHISSNRGQPVVGWMHDLEALTLEDIRDWYDAWYAPNNAIAVVVGDVTLEQVKALADRYFAPLPSREVRKAKAVYEIDRPGLRRLSLTSDKATTSTVMIGFNVPSLTSDDAEAAYALRMLAGVLDGGYSARIETELVRGQEVAAGASASYSSSSRGPTLLTMSGVPTPKHDLRALEKALLQQIERLRTEPVSEEELQRAKAQVISNTVYQLDSIQSVASQIGQLETIGLSWRDLDELPEKLAQITPEDIQTVAKKYLIPANMTVGYLRPKGANTQAHD